MGVLVKLASILIKTTSRIKIKIKKENPKWIKLLKLVVQVFQRLEVFGITWRKTVEMLEGQLERTLLKWLITNMVKRQRKLQMMVLEQRLMVRERFFILMIWE